MAPSLRLQTLSVLSSLPLSWTAAAVGTQETALAHTAAQPTTARQPAGGTTTQEVYSQNAICRQNFCTNPLTPGLNDLPRLELIGWQCTARGNATAFMDFCRDVVYYDPALPSPNRTATTLSALVKSQDDAASTMFFYHLSGMGYDAWDHQNPGQDADHCVRSIHRMVCYTYFPKAEAGCGHGQPTTYKRPCRNACTSYLEHCNIECCDESPQCVFQHHIDTGVGVSMLQTGYVDEMGPSAMCTGGALERRSGAQRGAGASILLLLSVLGLQLFGAGAAPRGASEGGAAAAPRQRQGSNLSFLRSRRFWSSPWLAATVLVVIAVSLQGCAMDVPRHHVGNWRRQPDYLVGNQFVMPGAPSNSAVLNSCNQRNVPATLQCSGRGYCKSWRSSNALAPVQTTNPVLFCQCERDFAGPECRIRRKSQLTTFLLSLFLGWLGVDYFYLGFPLWGIMKLFTLGGCGFWWLVDVIRTGSGAVYAHDFRVAADLPHWVYVLVTLTVFMMLGFFVAIESYLSYRNKRRSEQLKMQAAEEHAHMGRASDFSEYGVARHRGYGGGGSRGREMDPHFGGYGATIGAPQGSGAMPYGAPPMAAMGAGGPYGYA